MNKHSKLVLTILRGFSDNNIAFDDLRNLLKYLGFDERIKASHHLYRKAGITEMINLQREGNKAKSYQVRQVRIIILKYKLQNEK